jgi:hypothetical protein
VTRDAEEFRDSAHYKRSLEIHQAIEALYARVEEYRAHFRDWMRADVAIPTPAGKRPRAIRADPWVCALAIKAATTKRAIAILCDAGDGDNAIVLARVLMENACLLEWLMRGEYRERIDAYILWNDVVLERRIATVQRFADRFAAAAGRDPELKSDPERRWVAEYIFGDARTDRPTWIFRRAGNCAESDQSSPSQSDKAKKRGRTNAAMSSRPVAIREMFEGITASFEHQVLYGAIGSDIVHSGPTSLSQILSAIWSRTTFILHPIPDTDHCTIALALSNVAMLLVLGSLNEFLGLDMSAALEELKARSEKDPT